jgi:hypothetical protein
LLDALFIVYVVVIFSAWLSIGGPNPRGFGYVSKGIELLLIVALLAHLWTVVSTRSRMSSSAA